MNDSPAYEPMDPLSLQFDWLPSEDRLVLSSIINIRRSTQRTDGYEVNCRFDVLGSDWRPQAWAPCEQFGLLKRGTVFENRQLVGIVDRPTYANVLRFSPELVRDISIMGGKYIASDERRPATPRPGDTYGEMPHCVGTSDGRRVYLPGAEILRFYFGSLSLVANRFLSNPIYGELGEGLVATDQTGFIEDGIFRIAPHPGLSDRGSALRLALLLASPDLLQLWQRATRLADTFQPEVMLSEGPHGFALRGKRELIHHSRHEWQERAFVAWSIESDYRKAPFTKLIIRPGFGSQGEELIDDLTEESDQNEAGSREWAIGPNARLQSVRRPGRAGHRLSYFQETVRQAFPGLARVQIEYEIDKGPRRTLARKPAELETREVEALSALSPGHDRSVAGVVFRPPTHFPEWAQTDTPSRRLFEEFSGETAQLAQFDVATLVGPLPVFIAAMRRCATAGKGRLALQDFYDLAGDKVTVMIARDSWGRAANGRAFVVGEIDAGRGTAYAFELVRKSAREHISIGLVGGTDGARLSLSQLSAVACHAVQQLSGRGTDRSQRHRGIWPSSAVYSDISARPLPHTRTRSSSLILSEDLVALTEAILPRSEALALAS